MTKGPAWLPWRRPSRPPKVEPLKQLGSEQQQISKKSLDSDQAIWGRSEIDRLAERAKELEKVVKAAKRMRREFPVAMDPLTIEDAWAIARRFDVALSALPAHQE